jgi:uncharacterized membrane protein
MKTNKAAVSHRLDRNIEALLSRQEEEKRQEAMQDRAADRITRFAGSMTFVYLHVFIFGGWISINLGFVPVLPSFDPSLVVLAMVASVEAIFISTFVLISQNRMSKADAERADLNLQISLLSEHETTQLIVLVSALAEKMGVQIERKEELEELQQDFTPEEVLNSMERIIERPERRDAGRSDDANAPLP